MESVANWSDLPPELVVEIALKLKQFEDFTAVRGVCTSWRAAAAKDTFKGANLPLLMHSDNNYQDCKFYSLSKREIHSAAIPEAKGKRCTHAGFGWILAVAPESGEVCLFKPFSSSPAIPLFNFNTFPEYPKVGSCHDFDFFRKAILSADPSETSDFTVFALIYRGFVSWKNGDENWSVIKTVDPLCSFMHICYCRQKLYAIDHQFRLWCWDPSLAQLQLVVVVTLELSIHPSTQLYVMESTAGELLVIRCTHIFHGFRRVRTYFQVARIDVEKQEWEEIDDIGRDAIFVGENATVSVNVDDFPGVIMPNCIYYTNDYLCDIEPDLELDRFVGVYSLESRTNVEKFHHSGYSLDSSLPFWENESSSSALVHTLLALCL